MKEQMARRLRMEMEPLFRIMGILRAVLLVAEVVFRLKLNTLMHEKWVHQGN
jgi:hypothetical protein